MQTSCSVLICPHNAAHKAHIVCEYPVEGFPAANLGDPKMYTFWKTRPPPQTSVTLTLTLDRVESLRVFALLKHNLSSTGQWRIRVWYDRSSSDTPVYDSDWMPVSPGLSQFGALAWGTFRWGEFSYDLYMGGFNKQSIHVLDDAVIGSYVTVEIMDEEARTQHDMLSAAGFWLGDGWQPSFNASYGSSVSLTDNTLTRTATSGVTHASKRLVKRRQISLILENEDKYELMHNYLGPILASKGASSETLVVLEPLDRSTYPFEVVYGFLDGATHTATHSVFNRMSANVSIKESV